MQVLKFGGSSVANPERIKKVAFIIKESKSRLKEIVVVVSAFQGVTDRLLELCSVAAKGEQRYRDILNELSEQHINNAKELIPITSQSSILADIKVWLNDLEDILHGIFLVGEYSKRMLDYVMSFGERFSAYIIAAHIKSLDIDCEFLDAREIIKADESWGAARVDLNKTEQSIKAYFNSHKALQIVTGFIGSTPNNDTITLGRGGSDYTASLLGACLNSREIEIWTDVDGVMTADPRKVPKAFFIPSVTYEEMMELSHFGAKVIYPPTIQPALDNKIPVRIRNTFNPDFDGTLISDKAEGHDYLITGISSISEVALLRIQGSGMVGVAGVSMRLFGALARRDINIILITQASSEHTICLAVLPQFASEAKALIDQEFALERSANLIDDVIVENNLSVVSIVGENMRRMPGISAKLFAALGHNGINVVAIAQGSSELNISVVISKNDECKALNAIHDEFFSTKTKSINLFIAGTGLIGKTLIEQIAANAKRLRHDLFLDLRVLGIINRKKSIISESPIMLEDLNQLLDKAPTTVGLESFIYSMKELNLANSVFVDCTASEDVVQSYDGIINHSISIVTPNKKSQTREINSYKRLKDSARRRSVAYLYETSVGAGLPVISTLNDLIKSGDEILKIEAVLSGTLSYIFNSYNGETPFSKVVKQAKELGYTEPDPRDDLSGADVARKLLILARESGLTIELTDVEVQNLVPDSCRTAKNVEEFFKFLEKEDTNFQKKIRDAYSRKCKLCYIGKIEDGNASVSLREINSDHPFYNLSGSDNIISFTSKRYSDRPLVVKGPGAGAEVTAAGVFADIIRLS